MTDKNILKNKKLGDFDIWWKPCKCGYDPEKGCERDNGRCWKCGSFLSRDYSERALKNRSLEEGDL